MVNLQTIQMSSACWDWVVAARRTTVCLSELPAASTAPTTTTWHWLLIWFAAAGFLLVFFIAAFNLTVTQGITNGLIFYANIVGLQSGPLYHQWTCPSMLQLGQRTQPLRPCPAHPHTSRLVTLVNHLRHNQYTLSGWSLSLLVHCSQRRRPSREGSQCSAWQCCPGSSLFHWRCQFQMYALWSCLCVCVCVSLCMCVCVETVNTYYINNMIFP